MIEEYKKDLDKVHASEELIAGTLKAIEAERQNKEIYKEDKGAVRKPGKIIVFARYGAAIAAAAAVLLVVSPMVMNTDSYVYTEVSQVKVRSDGLSGLFEKADTEAEETMSEDEFNEYIGLDCRELFESLDYISSDIKTGSAVFYYGNDEINASVTLSKSGDIIPEALEGIEKSKVGGQELTLAYSRDTYYGAFANDEITYYISVTGTDRDTFEQLIKEFQKNLKKVFSF